MRPTSAPQRSLVACRPRPGPASGRPREPGPPRPQAASRCEDPALRPQEACSGVRPLQTHVHIASATLAERVLGSRRSQGPEAASLGRRWATWLTVPGGRCRAARPGPAAQGPALPLSKPDTLREEGAGPPGRNEAASAHARDARSGRPRWPAQHVDVLGLPRPRTRPLLPPPRAAALSGHPHGGQSCPFLGPPLRGRPHPLPAQSGAVWLLSPASPAPRSI